MKLTKRELTECWSQLRELMCDWDPIGIMDNPGAPRDEYDCLVGPLLTRLASSESEADIANYLRHQIVHHFGLSATDYDFNAVAKRVKAWHDQFATSAAGRVTAMRLFDIPQEVLDARPQGAKDFDFLQGRWLIHHKKLAERLVGCTTWHEFQTPAANQLMLGGLGNVDQCRTESGDFWEGASLRLFDKSSGLWRIYWMDTNGATLFPPLEGSFSDAVGLFGGHDQHDGIPVLVEFRWDKTDPEAPTWQQSFSADNGNSWEVNWYMSFTRVE